MGGKVGSASPLKGRAFSSSEDAIVEEVHIASQFTYLTMHLLCVEPVSNEHLRQRVDVTNICYPEGEVEVG